MGTPLKSGETVIGEIAVGLPLDVMVAPHGDNVFFCHRLPAGLRALWWPLRHDNLDALLLQKKNQLAPGGTAPRCLHLPRLHLIVISDQLNCFVPCNTENEISDRNDVHSKAVRGSKVKYLL